MPEVSQAAFEQIQELFRRVGALERGRVPEDPRALDTNTPQSQQIMLGKPTADLEQGTYGTFEIWSVQSTFAIDKKGSEKATGEFLPNVYNRAFDVTTEDLCYLMFVDGGLEASKAVC